MDTNEVEDTARLVLMEHGIGCGFIKFTKAVRVEFPDFSLSDAQEIYTRYCGWDGRRAATHDLTTGKPLRIYYSA